MRNIIALAIALSSFSTLASEMIWSTSKISSLDKQLSKNKILLKRKLGRSIVLERSELGMSTTPFYEVNGVAKKDFKNYLKNCYTLSFFETYISASSVNCVEKKFTITYQNETFESVETFEPETPKITFAEKSYSKSFEAYHHLFRDFNDNNRARMPFTEIEVKITDAKNLTFKKHYVSLNTKHTVSRSAYAFLGKRDEVLTQELKFEPFQGDMIFKSGSRLLLIKRFQTSPFTFVALGMGQKYMDYLETIESKLFPYQGTKRCFRDENYYAGEPSKFDCDQLIFKSVDKEGFQTFDGVLIDTDRSSIDWIKS